VITGLTLLAWALSQALGPGLADASGTNLGVDFAEFYMGGRFFLEGRMAELYNFPLQEAYQASLYAGHEDVPAGHGDAPPGHGDAPPTHGDAPPTRYGDAPPTRYGDAPPTGYGDALPTRYGDAPPTARVYQFHPFVYPPFAVLLFSPFALVGYVPGLLLWWGVGLLALGLSGYFLWRELFRASSPASPGRVSALRLLAASLLFYPTLAWFMYGQNTALTLALYTAVFLSLRRRRDFLAGALAGVLLYKPQLALALGWLLLIKGRWQALLGGLVTGGLLLAIFETAIAKMRVFRVPEFLGAALMLGLLGTLLLFVSRSL